MPTRLLALFTLRPGTAPAAYEHWATHVDLPTVKALPSIADFQVMRLTGRLGSEAPPPYQYGEIIDVADMDQFQRDIATPAMQAVAAEFNRLVDVIFLTTEPLSEPAA